MYLRHPVVISSLEEDFRKIGILPKKSLNEGAEMPAGAIPRGEGGDVGGGTGPKAPSVVASGGSRPAKGKLPAYGDKPEKADESEEIDEDAMIAEAMEFAEDFDNEFRDLADDTEISFAYEDIGELESLGEEIQELPGGIISESDEEDDDEEDDEDDDEEASDDEEDDVEEAKKGKMPAAFAKFMKKGKAHADSKEESVDPLADRVEGAFASATQEGFRRMAVGGAKAAGHKSFVKWKRSNPAAAHKKAVRDKKYHARSSVKSRLRRLSKTSRPGFRRESEDDSTVGRLSGLQDALAALSGQSVTEALDTALSAFAHIALISEKLHTLFSQVSGLNEEYSAAAQAFEELATESSEVVDNLQNDDIEVDVEALEGLFGDMVETLSRGIDAFVDLTETVDFDESGDDGKKGKKEQAA